MTFRRRGIWSPAVLLVLCANLSSCTSEPSANLTTAMRLPTPARIADADVLPFGKESAYAVVNEGDLADADALLHDVWNVPRYDPVRLPGGPTWTEDPYHEKYWRFDFYSLRPTTSLLWAYYRTGKSTYRDKLVALIQSYVRYDERHPSSSRLGMDDPHAMAFRAMVLVNIWAKLRRRGALPPALDSALLASIGRLADKLQQPVNFQGQYNHGVTQAVALLLVSVNMPVGPHSAQWAATARQRLKSLQTSTIDADGVENEKSPFYHFYVLEFLTQTVRWAAANHIALPPGLAERVDQMVRYATLVLWPDGQVPLEGSSVQLTPSRSVALYGPLTDRFPRFAYALSAGAAGKPIAERAVIFPASGQAILRSPVNDPGAYRDNSQLLLDVGAATSMHAHDEPLAFSYYSHGRVLLADSGLYTYTRGTAFDYFHGIRAHNTVTVDGRDQDGGPIVAGRTIAGQGWAYQSGTAAVYRGVVHRRSVLLLRRDLVLVLDDLTATSPHRFDQLWHLFPGARPLITDGTAAIYDEFDNPALRITQATTTARLQVTDHFGEINPMQGWYSSEYGTITANHVLAFTAEPVRAARYLTVIGSGPHAVERAVVRGTASDGRFDIEVCSAGYAAHVTITALSRPGERVSVSRRERCGND
ncbi:heparinase II/III domain-containing protein [Actinoplanes sp. CA-030573]|uniref:heparinase II/III domain-containing protein n=1 Tax=Actinoplanes sp. CA-030573 TaxID=3239898 RepID=UPI003D8CA560